LGEGIQVCSNEGDWPSQRGDDSKKDYWTFLKIFSRSSKPNSIKLGTNYPWLKREFKFVQILKVQVLFEGEKILQKCKIG
jgi:hypothetical protein